MNTPRLLLLAVLLFVFGLVTAAPSGPPRMPPTVFQGLGGHHNANRVNDLGQVAGVSQLNRDMSSPYHVFLWDDRVATDLGSLGGNGIVVTGMNNLGQVVGYGHTTSDYWTHAFVADSSGITDLSLLLPPGTKASFAFDINDSGTVAGSFDQPGRPTSAFQWNPATGMKTDIGVGNAWHINSSGNMILTAPNNAWLWEAATDTIVSISGGIHLIAGVSELTDTNWVSGGVQLRGLGPQLPFRWQLDTGDFEIHPGLGGRWGTARDINDLGEVVAYLSTPDGQSRGVFWATDGSSVVLDVTGVNTDVSGINNDGLIVGYDSGGHPNGAKVWDRSGAGTMLPGPANGRAVAVSEGGHVLGSAGVGGNASFSILWQAPGGNR